MTRSAHKTVVISLDAELGWGFHDHAELPEERIERARESWRYLVELFADHRIPVTWAIVGHLFLGACDGTHADHPAGAEWFDRDPGGERAPESRWFGGDLVRAVRDSAVDHDIGSHTFSHVEFGKRETGAAVAEAELERSLAAADGYGIDLDSFVFPRNNIGHRPLLRDYGFSNYRGHAPERWYDGTRIRRAGKLATFATGATGPPIVDPEIDECGLVNVPASLYLFTFEGSARDAVERVARDPVVRQVERGLERLRDRNHGVFHLWLHPNNVTTGRDRRRLDRVVSTVAEYRDRYGIDVDTMSGVAATERADG
mgnify:CR=1 FL=1